MQQQCTGNGMNAGQATLSVRTKSAQPEEAARGSPSADAPQQAMAQSVEQQPSLAGTSASDTSGSQSSVAAAGCKQALQEGVSSQEAAAKKLRDTWDAQVCPRAKGQGAHSCGL